MQKVKHAIWSLHPALYTYKCDTNSCQRLCTFSLFSPSSLSPKSQLSLEEVK